MTTTAVVLILISAVAHAGWNLLSKRRAPSAAFFLVTTVPVVLILLPILVRDWAVLRLLPAWLWLFIGLTGIFQTIYFAGLAGAYRTGDMSLAYPLARAAPVILVAMISLAAGRGAQIGRLGLAGMLLVTAGCFILPSASFRQLKLANFANLCCALALVAAVGTTGYTLIDDAVLRQLRLLLDGRSAATITLFFMSLQSISTMLTMLAYTLATASERQQLRLVLRQHKRYAAVTGLIIGATYGLVLAAMGFVTNVSYVAAFRQLSIPLGAILGIVIQREPSFPPKLAGIGVVSLGLVLVALG